MDNSKIKKHAFMILSLAAVAMLSACFAEDEPGAYCYVAAAVWQHEKGDTEAARATYKRLVPAVFDKKIGFLEDVARYLNGGAPVNHIFTNSPRYVDLWTMAGAAVVIHIESPSKAFRHYLCIDSYDYVDGWNDYVFALETEFGKFNDIFFTASINNGWKIDTGRYAGWTIKGAYKL